jgi:hypothetical protein
MHNLDHFQFGLANRTGCKNPTTHQAASKRPGPPRSGEAGIVLHNDVMSGGMLFVS